MKTKLNKQVEAEGKKEWLQAVLCNSHCSAGVIKQVVRQAPAQAKVGGLHVCKSQKPTSLWLTEF